jgi:two-component system, NarL family, nitrate/nitrite response regulator NarL
MSPQSYVGVTSDQSLIADTVRAALASRALRATRVPWPVEGAVQVPRPRRDERMQAAVMLCDLEPVQRLREARHCVQEIRVPWLVLTAAPRGPLWGAMLDAGATAVHVSSATIDDVRAMVGLLVAGERLMDDDEIAALLRAWEAVERERRAAIESVRSLSPREIAVLALMHAGESVQQIAELFHVSESTVRSHVRSVLQKLDVKTQLAAVAEYEMATGDGEHDSTD